MGMRCPLFTYRFYLSSFFLSLTFSLLLSAGLVTESTGAEKVPGSEPAWSTFLRGGYVHQFDSDIDSGGDFNTHRLALQGGVSHANDNGTIISLALGYGTDRYDFSGNRGFAGLRAWDNIHSFRFSVPVRLRYDNHWSVFVMPTVRATAESNADFDEGVSSGGFAGFSYRFSDRLTIGPGIGVITQIEDDTNVFPVLIVNWRITDHLSLETGRGLGATQGPGLTLNWKATEALNLSIGGRYERLRFRLDKDGVAPNGVGDDRSFPIFGSISYQLSEKIRASLLTGVELGGELRLEDEKGNLLSESDFDSAGFLGFTFHFLF